MRLILCGQRSFGLRALDGIANAGHDVALVVAPTGDPIHDFAWKFDVPNATELTPRVVENLGVDLIVGAHSHAFVSKKSRDATRLGAIGYHPSLLPRHRGRDAVRWTVAMGDPIAGGSVYWFTDNVDGGPVAAQDWCFVRPGMTHSELWREELFPMGLRLLGDVLNDLQHGRMVQIPQDERVATWEPSWERAPLHRPDLPAIGPGPEGMRLIASREAL